MPFRPLARAGTEPFFGPRNSGGTFGGPVNRNAKKENCQAAVDQRLAAGGDVPHPLIVEGFVAGLARLLETLVSNIVLVNVTYIGRRLATHRPVHADLDIAEPAVGIEAQPPGASARPLHEVLTCHASRRWN